jgi:hypothetical protein
MLQSANELLDLSGSDIRRREFKWTPSAERAVRSLEPRSSFLQVPFKELHGEADEPREPKQSV